jgi:hypothetical protein
MNAKFLTLSLTKSFPFQPPLNQILRQELIYLFGFLNFLLSNKQTNKSINQIIERENSTHVYRLQDSQVS